MQKNLATKQDILDIKNLLLEFLELNTGLTKESSIIHSIEQSKRIEQMKTLDLVKFMDFIKVFELDYKTARKRYEHATVKKPGVPLMIRISAI